MLGFAEDGKDKAKEKDREFLYEVKWKDLSPAENSFESISRCSVFDGRVGFSVWKRQSLTFMTLLVTVANEGL